MRHPGGGKGRNGVGRGCVRVSLFVEIPRCANRDYIALLLRVRCLCKTGLAVGVVNYLIPSTILLYSIYQNH